MAHDSWYGATTTVGAVEPCAVIPLAPVLAQPGDEWARMGARPIAPVLTATPHQTSIRNLPGLRWFVVAGTAEVQ